MKDKIPVEDMKRIDDAAIDAASAYSPEHSFGHIAREYYRKGRIAEYLHSLQQKKDGVNSAIIACGDLVECLTRPPAGPVWVKASEGLPIVGTEIYFEFAYPGDPIRKFTGYFLDLDGDQGFSAIVGRMYYLDKYAQYIRWLDESPSPREAADREKKIALAFHKWVVEKDIWWEDEDQYWYKSISISESLHGNYTEYEKVCETDDELYDLFLQSNP